MDNLSPHQKGRLSERNVRRVLQMLRDEGVIRGFRQTRRHSADDREGIDFFIFTEAKRIPLQVKSSIGGAALHYHYTDKAWVPCVIGQNSFRSIRRQLLTIIHHMNGGSNGYPA